MRVLVSRLRRILRTVGVTVALLLALSALSACAPQRHYTPAQQEDSLEAQPLPDEDSPADKAGQMGVVGILVAAVVGGILLPIFLL